MPETVEAVLSPLLEEVVGPITESNPVGDDVSYDDDFLSLKDEVDQLSSVNPEAVDDGRILERCRLILGRKSKDLRVATYMALALARIGGYRGIEEGLLGLKLLVETYWEPMYPPLNRMRARQNALQFAAERLSETLPGLKPAAGDREAIENSLQAVKELQAHVVELMGDFAPVLSGLGRALEDANRKIPKEAPKEAAKRAPKLDSEKQDAVSSLPDSHSSAGESSPTDGPSTSPQMPSINTESDALEQVLKLAGFIREQKPFDPVPYRLARCALWDAIAVEPNNEDRKTFLENPPPHRMTYLNSLFDAQEWPTLLEEAESAFREAPFHFWLDLQRFIVGAMGGLGGEYEQAKDCVLLETAVLLKRVSSLPQLTFVDGTPFADPKTKFWLEEAVAPVLTSESSHSAKEDEKLEARFREAGKHAAAGKLPAAIHVLQDGLHQDGTRRGRFLLRLAMARMCMQANKPAVASPILENLESEIEALTLHEWEPALALEVWSQLHQCYGMLNSDEAGFQDHLEEKAQRVFARICHVDPARALEH